MTNETVGPAPWPRHGCFRLERGLWFAPSLTHPGAYWLVRWDKTGRLPAWFSCGCACGVARGNMGPGWAQLCRHVRLVVAAEQDDGLPERASPPPSPAIWE